MNILWNRKESYLKCIGTGLQTDPAQVCVFEPEQPAQEQHLFRTQPQTLDTEWNFGTEQYIEIAGKKYSFIDGVSNLCTASMCCEAEDQ